MFMVLSSWQIHCESSPSSFDECRMAPSLFFVRTSWEIEAHAYAHYTSLLCFIVAVW